MNIEIEESKVNRLLKELFFDEVIGPNRIRYAANKQDYDFTPKMDGVAFGREFELSVEIFSPNYSGQNVEELKKQTMGLPVLRLVTDSDSEFMDGVRMYLKQEDSDNTQLRDTLIKRAGEILGSAKAFVDGSQLDILFESSVQRFVTECFQHLIMATYPNLSITDDYVYTDDTFKHILRGFPVPDLFEEDDDTVPEAESKIVDFLKSRKKKREQTSVYDLRKHFSKRPFGWYDNAIFTLLAKLYKKNKIEVTTNRNPLNEDELVGVLLDTSKHNSAYVEIQIDYSMDKIMDLKLMYTIISETYVMNKDDMEVARDFPNQLRKYADEVNMLLKQKKEFPFVTILQRYYDELYYWSGKNYRDVLDNINILFSLMMNVKEDEYDPIYEFINGEKGDMFRNIAQTVEDNLPNIDFVEGNELRRLSLFIKHPHPYRGNLMSDADEYRKKLEDKMAKLIENERDLTIHKYEEELITLLTHPEIMKLKESDSARLLAPMEKKMAAMKTQRFIGNLRAARADLPEAIVGILNQAARHNAAAAEQGGSAELPVKYVNKNNISVSFDKSELTTEEDVRAYAKELERELLEQIGKNKRIRL